MEIVTDSNMTESVVTGVLFIAMIMGILGHRIVCVILLTPVLAVSIFTMVYPKQVVVSVHELDNAKTYAQFVRQINIAVGESEASVDDMYETCVSVIGNRINEDVYMNPDRDVKNEK